LLDDGIRPWTVLWLGELREYTSGEDDGAAVLGRVARLLEDQHHVIAVTTMWPGHWDAYAAAARTGTRLRQDPAGTAGRLLGSLPALTGHPLATVSPARGGVIDVPAAFTAAEVIEAASTSQVLADAARAATRAGQDGEVAQYLAGVPDLLARYQDPAGEQYGSYGQAVIKAAMDAARLGCQELLSAEFLIAAAPGYLGQPGRPPGHLSLDRTRARVGHR